MLTRLTLLKSAIMGVMTSIGYPDYLKPRDYLAGLASSQVAASQGLGAGVVTIYAIPANKTLIMRSLAINITVVGNGAGVYCFHNQLVYLAKGFDGASPNAYIASLNAMATPTGYANVEQVLETQIEVQGGATGNSVVAQGTLTNAANWAASAQIYGALIG